MRIQSDFNSRVYALLLAALFASALTGLAAPKSWTGAISTDWFNGGNWDPSLPVAGDDVTIGAAARAVLLTNSTPSLNSLAITNNSLIFTNWLTTLNATTVNIQSGGVFTMSGSFTNNQMSNRIYIVCADITIERGGSINADAHGYYPWSGPGAGDYFEAYYYHAGGSYGGRGGSGGTGNHGNYWAMDPYGSASAPVQPGSGGGSYNTITYKTAAGSGGGAVRIAATGAVTVRGTLSANGGAATHDYSAGGSGGAIYIDCQTFGGDTNGLLRVNGGNPLNTTGSGGGGGGRIAVNYTTATPGPRFSAAPATVSWAYQDLTNCFHYLPMPGTLWLPDTQLLGETLDQTLFAGAVNI
jgi:hypothetical protein